MSVSSTVNVQLPRHHIPHGQLVNSLGFDFRVMQNDITCVKDAVPVRRVAVTGKIPREADEEQLLPFVTS